MGKFVGVVVTVGVAIAIIAAIHSPPPEDRLLMTEAQGQAAEGYRYFGLRYDIGLRSPLPIAVRPVPVTKPPPEVRPAAAAEWHPNVGDRTYLTATTIACPDSDTLDRVIGLLRQDDKMAMLTLAASSGCTFLDQGQPVFYERPTLFGNVGVHLPGDPTILWVNPGTVKR